MELFADRVKEEKDKSEEKEHYEMESYSFSSSLYSIRTITNYRSDPISSLHQQIDATEYGTELMYIATIPHRHDYGFTTECCEVNLTEFCKKHEGAIIGINGVFHRFRKDYVPLGHYKQGEIESYVPLQSAYAPFFRMIAIDYQGKLTIEPHDPNLVWQRRKEYHSMMECGPLLIDRGEPIVTNAVLEKEVNGVRIFQCENADTEKTYTFQKNGRTYLSCTYNRPGGLFHAANTNPRSAMVTDTDGVVYMIHVPGRKKGVLGMDLVRFAELIKEHIPNAWMAINLDGGKPSKLVHKDVEVWESNDHSIRVGNIIVYRQR